MTILRFTSSEIPPQEIQKGFQVEHTEDDGTIHDEEDEITVKDTVDMLLRAIGWYAVHNTMSKYTSTAVVQCTDVPFMRANFGYFLTSSSMGATNNEQGEHDRHSKRLNNVLKSWNFVRVDVPGDGNCLFTSVAISVKSMCQQHQSPLVAYYKNLELIQAVTVWM